MEISLAEFQKDLEFPFFVQYGRHDLSMPFHRHKDFNELVFVLSGSAQHRVNGELYPIVQGDVFVITGDTAHGFEDARDLRLFNIMYQDAVLGNLVAELRKMEGYQALFVVEPQLRQGTRFASRLRIGGNQLAEAGHILASLEAEYARAGPGWIPAVLGLFIRILVLLSRWNQESPSDSWPHPLQLARGFSRLESAFHQNLRLADLATDCGLSERHFRRLFQESYGLSPQRYILNKRVQLACDLLQKTDIPLADLALRCGFTDQGHMGRWVRSLTKRSPGEWRSGAHLVRCFDR